MAPRSSLRHLCQHALLWMLTAGSVACASESLPPRLYDITTETGMPHLEENLRYAVTHARRCLAQQDLATAFPILDHPALKGCRLDRETREGDRIIYALSCEGGHGTTGDAVWDLDEHHITGTLHVKLGGKNMTFYQRLTAKAVGACVRELQKDH